MGALVISEVRPRIGISQWVVVEDEGRTGKHCTDYVSSGRTRPYALLMLEDL